jgi:Zn-dependent peptidase ImmA (M78 family)
MNIAKRKALEIADKYGGDLEAILDLEGVQVIDVPLAGRLKELYFGDVIVLREGLLEPEKKELTAHALGHHFLHAGNHMAASSGAYSWDKIQERQAEVFAAYLLMPKLRLTTRHLQTAILNLVEEYGVTEKFARFRLKLLQAYKG